MTAPAVRIEGLRDLQRELRAVDKALPRELRIVHKDVAEIIASAAQRRARALGGIHAKAASGIKAGAEQRSGFIRLRPTATLPFLLGAEFGAKHNEARRVRTPSGAIAQRLGWNQLPDWRGNRYLGAAGGVGYSVYPTIREKGEEIVSAYEERLDQLLRKAFPD